MKLCHINHRGSAGNCAQRLSS